MKQHPLNNLKNAAEHIRLSQEEKATMRAYLYDMMAASNAQAHKYAHPTRSPFFFFAYQRTAYSFALVALMLVGTTTTYAAQGSLPGSILYPVKIYVNENVQETLAVSPEAKVSFHTAVAEERLKEAEALAVEGKLDAAAASKIEENFNEHVEKADVIATSLEEKNTAASVEARVALDSSIVAHASILANIADNSKDEKTRENSNSIAMRVQSRNQGGVLAVALKTAAPAPTPSMQPMAFSAELASGTATDASNTMDARVAAKTSAPVAQSAKVSLQQTSQSSKRVAMDLEKKAGAQLRDAEESFNDARASLSASTTAKVKLQLSSLQKNFSAGKKQMKNEDYDAARDTYTDVIRTSVELKAFIDASKLYKRDFVGSLWGEVRGVIGDDDHEEVNDDLEQHKGEVKATTTLEVKTQEPEKNSSGPNNLDGSVHINLGL
jgi:hypothetical protein